MFVRYPTMHQSLRLASEIAPESISEIVDVGVQSHTDFLVDVFPDKMHHLFEPASVYHPAIADAYTSRKIPHRLHTCALGDVNGKQFLHKISQDGSGNVTHSQLRATRDEKMEFLLEIEEIEVKRLDDAMPEKTLKDLSYLVKLDVDGAEERIIAGGPRVLGGASFVVIECSMGRQNMCSRAALLEKLGFRIFDICDNAYYFGQLALVDLVMINNRLRKSDIRFRPWDYAGNKVIWDQWQQGFPQLAEIRYKNPLA